MSRDGEHPPSRPQFFPMSLRGSFQHASGQQRVQFQAAAAPSIPARFQQALALHQQGRLAEAENAYREVLRHAPEHFDALHLLGVLALQTLRTESGVELIAKALALNPQSWGAHNNLGNGLRELGRLEAALDSFDSSIALKPDFAQAHNNRGIVLQDLGRLADALAGFDAAIALQPDYAEAHNNRGTVLQKLDRPDDAAASFSAAIAIKRDYAEAYNNRGNLAKDRGKLEDAVADFDGAIALRRDYATAHYNRGIALQELRRFDEALASFDAAIALKPDYAQAYNNRGLVLQELRRPHDAIASFDRTIALMPDYAEAHSNQSLSLLQVGDFDRGWRAYEWRKKVEQGFGNRAFAEPLWLGQEDISRRTVFVHWEQGFGDTIQFSRYAQLLKTRGARVVMSVQDPLYRLFGPMSPDISIIHQAEVPDAFDYHCPLLSLPLAFATRLETIPAKPAYVFADEQLREAWHCRLGPKTKPRIGVVWSGGPKSPHRSIALATLASLLSANEHWISLQKEPGDDDANLLRQIDRIESYSAELTDFAETAALIDLLDLVISVDTSVAHLAGAMGKPVWILLPYNSEWRWLLDRGDSPWYPTARLFRQDGARSWQSVIAQVRSALDDFVRRRS